MPRIVCEARIKLYDEYGDCVDTFPAVIVEDFDTRDCITRWFIYHNNPTLNGCDCGTIDGYNNSWVFLGLRGKHRFENMDFPQYITYCSSDEWLEKRKDFDGFYTKDFNVETWYYTEENEEDEENEPIYEIEIEVLESFNQNKFKKIKI